MPIRDHSVHRSRLVPRLRALNVWRRKARVGVTLTLEFSHLIEQAATLSPSQGSHVAMVRHTFETAHRVLPLGGKCRNLHGHSWHVEASVAAPALDDVGVIVQFADLKAAFRAWIDNHVDHGVMLGVNDPIAALLRDEGCKVLRFGVDDSEGPERFATDLPWPTVEAVAVVLARVASDLLTTVSHVDGAVVSGVRVQETPVNLGEWRPPQCEPSS